MVSYTLDDLSERAFVVYRMNHGGVMPWHKHKCAALECVISGILTLQTQTERWILTSQKAVLLLPGVIHRTYSPNPFNACYMFFGSRVVKLPQYSTCLFINTLMRELLLTVAKFGPEYKSRSAEWRLINIIFDLLPKMRAFPICLPEPKDDRLQRITQELFINPNDASSLSVLATSAGLSMRTADRLFQKEIGMSFGKWRQQLRLIIALRKLADGEKITNVSLDIGYNNVSSFNSMFKKNFNIPPSHFIRQINDINIPTMASTQVSKIPLSSPIKYAELFWQSPENKMYLYSASLE